ncbi:MAG: histidine kinase, partial [Nostocales cyanobacterium LE14-WE4]|nr:histidine kinase [Nostocales cyanobacterium LE14-WE4]
LANALANANALAYAANSRSLANAALALAYALPNALAYANTLALALANALDNDEIIDYANFLTFSLANANAKIIDYISSIEKLQIFNQKLNFTVLLTQLEALKAKIPDDKQPKEIHQAFAKTLRETLLNGLNLTPEMINLSKEEIKALDNYLYVNYLIIQCKEAAVRVSPATWEGIEARMLLVDKNNV